MERASETPNKALKALGARSEDSDLFESESEVPDAWPRSGHT